MRLPLRKALHHLFPFLSSVGCLDLTPASSALHRLDSSPFSFFSLFHPTPNNFTSTYISYYRSPLSFVEPPNVDIHLPSLFLSSHPSLSTLASSSRLSPAADESHLAALVEIVSPGDVLFDPSRTTTTIVTSIPSTTTTSPAEGTATYGSDRYRDDDDDEEDEDDDISDDDDIAGSTSSYLASAYRKPAAPLTSTFGLPSQPPAVPHFRTYPTATGVEEYTAETKAKDAKMDGKRQLNSFQQLEKLGEGTYATVCPLPDPPTLLAPALLAVLIHLPGLQRSQPPHRRVCCTQRDPPRLRGRNSLDCDP